MGEPFYRCTLRLDASHPCLPGHFPGAPVFPGVLVLQALAEALQTSRGQHLRTLLQVKYLQPWAPGDVAELTLSDIGVRIGFELSVQGRVLARGQVEAQA